MIRLELELELKVQGPFITKASAPGAWGLDACLMRNAQGTPVITGTHLLGKLRQAWEELAALLKEADKPLDRVPDQKEIDDLLGRPSTSGNLERSPKRLWIGDLALDPPSESSGIRYRIRIDPERGAVQDRAQLMVESPFASGQEIRFSGPLQVLCKSPGEARRIQRQIDTSLKWINQLGAFRSQGFGRLVAAGVTHSRQIPLPDAPAAPLTDEMDLVLKPLAPLCVDATTPSDNLFESSEVIPGGTLVGALAARLELAGEEFDILKANLSRLRVRHAFPSRDCHSRPVTPPLSLAQTAKGLCDLALQNAPCLVDGQAPVFAPDWKDDGPKEQFGWPQLARELRVRTAIDPDQLRPKENQLYSYDMVVPENHYWLSNISLRQVPKAQRRETAAQLQRLLGLGLTLGKTKTPTQVETHPAGNVQPMVAMDQMERRFGSDGLIAITLQTDALLPSPAGLDETSGPAELHRAYAECFEQLSGESLELSHYYARQRLAGGNFLARNKGRWGQSGEDYYPWLLTQAGSVFLFHVKNEPAATACLDRWLQQGLPLPQAVRHYYRLDGPPDEYWRSCPYLPQNGYGEIAVNLELHERWFPKNRLEPISVLPEQTP